MKLACDHARFRESASVETPRGVHVLCECRDCGHRWLIIDAQHCERHERTWRTEPSGLPNG